MAGLKCRVTTFHALGRGIIEETEGRPPQLADWVEHPAGEAKAIEEIVEDLLGSNPEFAKLWIDLLVLYLRPISPPRSLTQRPTMTAICRCASAKAGRRLGRWPACM